MPNEERNQVKSNQTKPTANNRETRMDFSVVETNTRNDKNIRHDSVNRIVQSGQNPPPRD